MKENPNKDEINSRRAVRVRCDVNQLSRSCVMPMSTMINETRLWNLFSSLRREN